jgi:hypothetical protein
MDPLPFIGYEPWNDKINKTVILPENLPKIRDFPIEALLSLSNDLISDQIYKLWGVRSEKLPAKIRNKSNVLDARVFMLNLFLWLKKKALEKFPAPVVEVAAGVPAIPPGAVAPVPPPDAVAPVPALHAPVNIDAGAPEEVSEVPHLVYDDSSGGLNANNIKNIFSALNSMNAGLSDMVKRSRSDDEGRPDSAKVPRRTQLEGTAFFDDSDSLKFTFEKPNPLRGQLFSNPAYSFPIVPSTSALLDRINRLSNFKLELKTLKGFLALDGSLSLRSFKDSLDAKELSANVLKYWNCFTTLMATIHGTTVSSQLASFSTTLTHQLSVIGAERCIDYAQFAYKHWCAEVDSANSDTTSTDIAIVPAFNSYKFHPANGSTMQILMNNWQFEAISERNSGKKRPKKDDSVDTTPAATLPKVTGPINPSRVPKDANDGRNYSINYALNKCTQRSQMQFFTPSQARVSGGAVCKRPYRSRANTPKSHLTVRG